MELFELSVILFLCCINFNILKVGKELECLNKKIEELTDTVWRSRDENS